jgi:signal transduction histidine kinase
MQNRWFTYGFLILMVSALVTLAVLQYQWLGSVSDAERQRLEEGIEASSENFVTDFNQVFSNLQNNFRIQVTNESTDITPMLAESYLRWQDSFDHSDVLSEVIFIQISDDDDIEYFFFDSADGELKSHIPDSSTIAWVSNNQKLNVNGTPTVSLNSIPEFGSETFIDIPIQVLDFITLQRNDGADNLEVQLSINRLNDLVLLRIDNEYVKTELIPEIASTYFGESYDDQYQISVLKSGTDPYIYFNSQPSLAPIDPDMKVRMDRFNFSSIVMLEDGFGGENFNFMESDSVRVSYRETNSNTTTTRRSFKHIAQFESRTSQEVEVEQHQDTVFGFRIAPTQIDTAIATAFVGNISTQAWELWLSFKAGSLDEFVQKTRNTNLVISFGILFILGICSVLIVVFAQRSRDLAEQQMLFVAGVSHELRTPLTVIRSAAENLSEGVIQSEDRKKQYAQLVLKEGRRLSEMVDQIMEFSGIQTGKRIYSFSDVDVELLMTEIKDEFQPIFTENGQTLEYSNISKLNSIHADRDALFLAITNLLQNAIKFSNGSDRIILRLDEMNYKSGLALRIQVQDFGVGIPSEEQNEVFKPFYRSRRSVDNQVKGNGIGLSLVEKVAKAHQGSAELKSVEGEGSTFTLIIPYHV